MIKCILGNSFMRTVYRVVVLPNDCCVILHNSDNLLYVICYTKALIDIHYMLINTKESLLTAERSMS